MVEFPFLFCVVPIRAKERTRRRRRSELECFVAVYMILTQSGVTRTRRTLLPASCAPARRVKYTPRVSFRFDIEDGRQRRVDKERDIFDCNYYPDPSIIPYLSKSNTHIFVCVPTSVNSRQSVKTRPSATKGERKTKQDGRPRDCTKQNLRKVEISTTGPTDGYRSFCGLSTTTSIHPHYSLRRY